MTKRRAVAALEKHSVDVMLIAITLASTVLMFISSSDPIIDSLKGSTLQTFLTQFTTGNQIIFDLAVAMVAGVFMYALVVRLPEFQKRRRLRRHLLRTYDAFKSDIISVYLGCIHTSYSASLPDELAKPDEFKKYFKEQDRWGSVANALDEYKLRLIVLELEVLRQELLFVIGAIDIADDEVLGFFRRLSQVIFRARMWTPDYDDVKSMMRFLWSLHTGWSFVNGYPEEDPVLAMASKI